MYYQCVVLMFLQQVISGKSGQYFDHVLIRGMLPGGVPFQSKAYPLMVPIYLHGIFVKQRLDYLVGQVCIRGPQVRTDGLDRVVRRYCVFPYLHFLMFIFRHG